MPVLLIQAGTPDKLRDNILVDGTLPQDVFRDFGFVTITEQSNDAIGSHQSNLSKMHSFAALLSVLVDQHGWEISNVANACKYILVYVLIKKK